MADTTYPTLLDRLVRQGRWSIEETCAAFERAAREMGENGTLSTRQLKRWMSGDVGRPRPVSRRVAERFWGFPFEALLGPAEVTPGALAAPMGGHLPSREIPTTKVGDGVDSRTLSEEIVMATEESARFVRRARGSVDQDVIDQLNADVRQLARDFLVRPPYAMFRPISLLRSEVFGLLDARQRPAHLPALYRVAGQLCGLLAHACADLGNPYASETHARTAWLCADMAEDNQLRSYVRWIQSNTAYWGGDYRLAADFATDGQKYAIEGTSLLRLSSQEARAHAAAADTREVERTLATASAARERDTPDEDPGGVFRFDPGKAAYYASEVRLALGGDDNYRKAATEAQRALDLFAAQPGACAEFIAAAQLDLVQAYLALRDLDGATDRLQPVLRLPSENRTVPVVQRVAKISRTLDEAAFAGAVLALDMREALALFRAYPAARELPALPSGSAE